MCIRDRAIAAPTKTHKLEDGTDYYTINPLGYVPLLVLDDGRQLHEGPAIVQYIADQVPVSYTHLDVYKRQVGRCS